MAIAIPAFRSFMSTLTSGWRFTLPAGLRDAKGWDEGARLLATASGQVLELRDVQASGDDAPRSGDPSAECYLGAGGKIIVPAALRKTLHWVPGKRLIVADDGEGLSVSPCCALARCRSCGSTVDVREIIANVHLCGDCWGKYAAGVRQTHAFPAQRRSF